MKCISVTYMDLQCPHGDKNKKRNSSSSSSSYRSEGSGKFPFNQLSIGDADKYVIFCSKLMADIYTKLCILSLRSIFSKAMEIPNNKNHMNKVLTTPLINWTISSKLLTHHGILNN
jgi:hypothetical protein